MPGNIALNPVLCRPTLDEMEEYVAFFGAMGLEDIRFNYIWPQGEVGRDRRWIPYLQGSHAEDRAHHAAQREALAQAPDLREDSEVRAPPGRGEGPDARVSCGTYLDEAGFDPDNDVSMATKNGPMPDRFVWQKVKKDTLKAKGPRCARCAHHDRCEGVWGSYGGTLRILGVDAAMTPPSGVSVACWPATAGFCAAACVRDHPLYGEPGRRGPRLLRILRRAFLGRAAVRGDPGRPASDRSCSRRPPEGLGNKGDRGAASLRLPTLGILAAILAGSRAGHGPGREP